MLKADAWSSNPITPSATPAAGEAQALDFTFAPGEGRIFVKGNSSDSYLDYVRHGTWANVEFLLNGRSIWPPSQLVEPLAAMQGAVQATIAGDTVYLASSFFDPGTPLVAGPYGSVKTWGGLFAQKAQEGVKIRILQTDYDTVGATSRANVRTWMARLDAWISAVLVDPGQQDNLQYVVSMHPATAGILRQILTGGTAGANIATHHQKFMVVNGSNYRVAFCGGVDIEKRATPDAWTSAGLASWHGVTAKLHGSIARDLEQEFVLRWNREKDASTVAPAPNPWHGYEHAADAPRPEGDAASADSGSRFRRTPSTSPAARSFARR